MRRGEVKLRCYLNSLIISNKKSRNLAKIIMTLIIIVSLLFSPSMRAEGDKAHSVFIDLLGENKNAPHAAPPQDSI